MKRHYDNFNNQIDEFINSSQRGNGLTKNGKKSFSINEAVDKITRNYLAEVWKNNHHNTEHKHAFAAMLTPKACLCSANLCTFMQINALNLFKKLMRHKSAH